MSKMREHTGPKEMDFNFYFLGDLLKCKMIFFLVVQSKLFKKKNIVVCLLIIVWLVLKNKVW